jgi:hypothetical protein
MRGKSRVVAVDSARVDGLPGPESVVSLGQPIPPEVLASAHEGKALRGNWPEAPREPFKLKASRPLVGFSD